MLIGTMQGPIMDKRRVMASSALPTVAPQSKRLRAVATTKLAPKGAVSAVGNGSGSRKAPTATAPKPAPKARQRRITILAAKPNK